MAIHEGKAFLMGLIVRAAALGLFLASASAALGGENAVIEVNDSRKDTEIRIAKIFKDRLKIDPSLKIRGGDAEDLLLQIKLGANKERGLPVIAYLIDTQILRRDNDGKATSQVIGIDSFSNLKPAADKVAGLLEWANKWNSRTVPIRIYIAGDRVVVGQNLLLTKQAPLSENQLLSTFSTIVQFWPVLLKDLRAKGILE